MEVNTKKTKEDIQKEFEELAKRREQTVQSLTSINARLEQLKGKFQLIESLEKETDKPKETK